LSRVAGEDAGTYAITVGTLANSNYAITLTPVNFTISQSGQASLTLTSTTGFYGTDLTLTASGGSGPGAYTYALVSAGTAGCSVVSGVLSTTSPGTCTVTASRAASTNFLIASSSATTVTISKGNQATVSLTSGTGDVVFRVMKARFGGTCVKWAKDNGMTDACMDDYNVDSFTDAYAALDDRAEVSVAKADGPGTNYSINVDTLKALMHGADAELGGAPKGYSWVPFPFVVAVTNGYVTTANQYWVP